MERLSESQAQTRLAAFPDWSLNGDAIQRTFSFENFVAAMAFVNRVADHAERLQHHPDMLIRYNKVSLTSTTHDAGGLTEKDFTLAEAADACAKNSVSVSTKRKQPAR